MEGLGLEAAAGAGEEADSRRLRWVRSRLTGDGDGDLRRFATPELLPPRLATDLDLVLDRERERDDEYAAERGGGDAERVGERPRRRSRLGTSARERSPPPLLSRTGGT